jgi:hypothetical protein
VAEEVGEQADVSVRRDVNQEQPPKSSRGGLEERDKDHPEQQQIEQVGCAKPNHAIDYDLGEEWNRKPEDVQQNRGAQNLGQQNAIRLQHLDEASIGIADARCALEAFGRRQFERTAAPSAFELVSRNLPDSDAGVADNDAAILRLVNDDIVKAFPQDNRRGQNFRQCFERKLQAASVESQLLGRLRE